MEFYQSLVTLFSILAGLGAIGGFSWYISKSAKTSLREEQEHEALDNVTDAKLIADRLKRSTEFRNKVDERFDG